MSGRRPDDITELLQAVGRGSSESADRLIRAVYTDLRAVAEHRMAAVPPADSMQPTALVNECYLRLAEYELEQRDPDYYCISSTHLICYHGFTFRDEHHEQVMVCEMEPLLIVCASPTALDA